MQAPGEDLSIYVLFTCHCEERSDAATQSEPYCELAEQAWQSGEPTSRSEGVKRLKEAPTALLNHSNSLNTSKIIYKVCVTSLTPSTLATCRVASLLAVSADVPTKCL